MDKQNKNKNCSCSWMHSSSCVSTPLKCITVIRHKKQVSSLANNWWIIYTSEGCFYQVNRNRFVYLFVLLPICCVALLDHRFPPGGAIQIINSWNAIKYVLKIATSFVVKKRKRKNNARTVYRHEYEPVTQMFLAWIYIQDKFSLHKHIYPPVLMHMQNIVDLVRLKWQPNDVYVDLH